MHGDTTVLGAVAQAYRHVGGALGGRWGIACSGGADSMALAHACVALVGVDGCIVLHVDHGLSSASASVAQMVAQWCAGVGVGFMQRELGLAPGAGVEERARDARYAALRSMALQSGLRWIVTAHTASDQAETVLMRIIRGTGLHGLAAMAPARDDLLRPLLGVSGTTMRQYADHQQLPVWHDPMNQDVTLFRSRMRHQVLPMLARENPQLERALCDLAAQALSWQEDVAPCNTHLALPCSTDHIRALNQQQRDAWWQHALTVAALPVSKSAHHGLHRAIQFDAAGSRGVDIPGGRIVVEYGVLRLQSLAPQVAPPRLQVTLTPAQPFVVRTWQPGDRMQPPRLRGKSRKLSDLFIDAKVPAAQRRSAQVVVINGSIVWCEHLGPAWQITIDVTISSSDKRLT